MKKQNELLDQLLMNQLKYPYWHDMLCGDIGCYGKQSFHAYYFVFQDFIRYALRCTPFGSGNHRNNTRFEFENFAFCEVCYNNLPHHFKPVEINKKMIHLNSSPIEINGRMISSDRCLINTISEHYYGKRVINKNIINLMTTHVIECNKQVPLPYNLHLPRCIAIHCISQNKYEREIFRKVIDEIFGDVSYIIVDFLFEKLHIIEPKLLRTIGLS